jgi:hypothetical protein
MTKRAHRKALALWEAETREWAIQTAQILILAICGGEPLPARPYHVGVVLGPDEQPWVECPTRFLHEMASSPQAGTSAGWPPVRPWLVTSERIVGRLGDDRLYGYRWEHIVGCRIDLALGQERVSLDMQDGSPLSWAGPATAPMAVTAVYHLHGPYALLDHPGLAPLRGRRGDRTRTTPKAAALQTASGHAYGPSMDDDPNWPHVDDLNWPYRPR